MKKIFNVPIAQADFVHLSPAVLTNFQKKSCIKANYKQGLTWVTEGQNSIRESPILDVAKGKNPVGQTAITGICSFLPVSVKVTASSCSIISKVVAALVILAHSLNKGINYNSCNITRKEVGHKYAAIVEIAASLVT